MPDRELIDTGTDRRFVRRDEGGRFRGSDDVGRSLAQDVRRKAKTIAKPGQGDRGDRKPQPLRSLAMKKPDMLRLAAIGLAGLVVSACESMDGRTYMAEGQPSACFRSRDVETYSAIDESRVILKTRQGDYYRMSLPVDCPQIDWSRRIALNSRGSGAICRGDAVTLVVPTVGGTRRCTATAPRQLTSAEVAALPAAARP